MSDEQPPKRKLTMGTKILIGVIAGIAVGIFLGDRIGPFDVAGKIYVGLLQMTVLPYVVVSLIGKIGGLTMDAAKRLGGRAGLILLALWAISLVAVIAFPQSLPAFESGNFFSASLIEPPKQFDFLGLYLPTNPFQSLADNVVPAAVLFSILVGVALILVERKDVLLTPLGVISETLGNLSNAVVKFSPWGTFALSASAAGTLDPEQMSRLAGYIFTYTIAVLFLTFVAIPGFVAALTPFRFRQLLSGYREAGLTAFATGKLFAVLPMVIDSARNLLVEQGVDEKEAQVTADVFVPLAYPFPNAGKVLSLLFIPFAAWFVGQPLELTQYPALCSIGLLTFFGSPVAAIPFLLDLFRLPLDLFPLFLVAGIWCARLGDVLGAMHLSCFTLLSSAWNQGWLKLRPDRVGIWGRVQRRDRNRPDHAQRHARRGEPPGRAGVEVARRGADPQGPHRRNRRGEGGGVQPAPPQGGRDAAPAHQAHRPTACRLPARAPALLLPQRRRRGGRPRHRPRPAPRGRARRNAPPRPREA